jgi:nitroreductase
VDLSEAMRTTGAVRDFTDDVVADATILEILDDARFAPSGSNRQGWRVVAVSDPDVRRRLADLMVPVWSEYIAQTRLGETAFSAVRPTEADLEAARAERQPNPLLDDIESVPVVLVVAVDLRALAVIDKDTGRPSIVGGASIYPFCHNILLAARARGLGGVLTTLITRVETAARPVLGLPDTHALAGMLFLGVPVHQPTRLRRRPVDEFATIDRFDGRPLGKDEVAGR